MLLRGDFDPLLFPHNPIKFHVENTQWRTCSSKLIFNIRAYFQYGPLMFFVCTLGLYWILFPIINSNLTLIFSIVLCCVHEQFHWPHRRQMAPYLHGMGGLSFISNFIFYWFFQKYGHGTSTSVHTVFLKSSLVIVTQASTLSLAFK